VHDAHSDRDRLHDHEPRPVYRPGALVTTSTAPMWRLTATAIRSVWLPGANNIPVGYVPNRQRLHQANNANAVPGSAYYGTPTPSRPQPFGIMTMPWDDSGQRLCRAGGFWLIRGANDTAPGVCRDRRRD